MAEILALSAAQVCRLTGLTPRQLSSWDRTGFFSPGFGQDGKPSPFARVYSFRDVVGLRALARMRHEYGIPLPRLRQVGAYLSEHSDQAWSTLTFYLVGRHVFLQEDREQAIKSAARSGQTVLPFPMPPIASEVQRVAAEVQARDRGDIGRVTRHRSIAENQSVLAGTRVPTRAIWEFHQAGSTEAAILREYPQLTAQDVRAAIQFERRRAAKVSERKLCVLVITDEDVPDSVARWLADRGHQVLLAREHFFPSTPDHVIATAASEQDAVVVTWNRRRCGVFWPPMGSFSWPPTGYKLTAEGRKAVSPLLTSLSPPCYPGPTIGLTFGASFQTAETQRRGERFFSGNLISASRRLGGSRTAPTWQGAHVAARGGHNGRASTDIVEHIKAAIFEGQLRPGDRLPAERELGEQFGVSRATVRDAIRVLESGGLVRVQVGAHGGPFVAEPSIHSLAESLNNHLQVQGVSLRELAELRLAIETEAAALAAQRATAEDLEGLAEVLQTAARRDDSALSAATSIDFHLLVAGAAHNGALLAVLSAVRELLREALETMHAQLPDMAGVAVARHGELYQALARRDVESARTLMRQHLEDFDARRRLCALE